jgi:rhodanese-related sulfurtransferase
MISTKLGIFAIILMLGSNLAYSKGDFPGRTHKKYKKVPYIELQDLHKRLSDVVVVDARSKFEFDTLRIKGAVNIPVAFDDFEKNVIKLRKTTPKTIVFYCNGHTCMKSYKATKRALAAGVEDALAYDAGIFAWSKAYPDQAELLGNSPVRSKDIISKKKFKARMLDPDTFSDRATIDHSKVAIIDIRDMYQRAAVGFFPGLESWTSLNKMEKLYGNIKRAHRKNKTIYIYDEVGKQVRWLQYALEKIGVKDYYFMEKGAKGYYKMLSVKYMAGRK